MGPVERDTIRKFADDFARWHTVSDLPTTSQRFTCENRIDGGPKPASSVASYAPFFDTGTLTFIYNPEGVVGNTVGAWKIFFDDPITGSGLDSKSAANISLSEDGSFLFVVLDAETSFTDTDMADVVEFTILVGEWWKKNKNKK